MRSKVAEKSEKALRKKMQELTPEQRLNAFLQHCQLVTSLRNAGDRLRSAPR